MMKNENFWIILKIFILFLIEKLKNNFKTNGKKENSKENSLKIQKN